MNYSVIVDPHAARQLRKIDPGIRKAILPMLVVLETDPRPPGAKKLKGSANGWRMRFAGWRILYTVDDATATVIVLDIDKRDKAYKRR